MMLGQTAPPRRIRTRTAMILRQTAPPRLIRTRVALMLGQTARSDRSGRVYCVSTTRSDRVRIGSMDPGVCIAFPNTRSDRVRIGSIDLGVCIGFPNTRSYQSIGCRIASQVAGAGLPQFRQLSADRIDRSGRVYCVPNTRSTGPNLYEKPLLY